MKCRANLSSELDKCHFVFKHLYSEPGSYTITFQVSNAAGKSDTSTVLVEVVEGQPVTPTEIPVPLAVEDKAELLTNNKIDTLLAEIRELRSLVREQQTQIKYLKTLTQGLQEVTTETKNQLTQFITYGVDNQTKKLGEKERASIIASYKDAFKTLPETEEEFTDIIKIANGEEPNQESPEMEAWAEKQFKKIYKRAPNVDNPKDEQAINMIAYGVRPQTRNLKTEQQALKTFRRIYRKAPTTIKEWNILRAIAYSGVK
jgi:hypothetical protein